MALLALLTGVGESGHPRHRPSAREDALLVRPRRPETLDGKKGENGGWNAWRS